MSAFSLTKSPLAILILAMVSVACGSDDEAPVSRDQVAQEQESVQNPIRKMPLAQTLAIADKDGYVEPDDISVKRIEYLTKRISQATGATPERVGDVVLFSKLRLRDDYGKDVKILELLEETNRALSGFDGKAEIEVVMALLIMYYANN